MISVDGLTVEFGGTTLFSDISFQINERDRIALMGKNGAGKSTLLKILAGVRQPTRGKVTAPKDCVVAYLPQHLMTEDGRTVFEEASQAFAHLREMEEEIERMNNELATRTDYESDSYMELIEKVAAMSEKFYAIDMTHFEEDVEKALLGLGFVREDFNRPTSDFSGGWRMRIELAKLLLQNPDVLLLDEPTNHLDIDGREALINALNEYNGSVILITHDIHLIELIADNLWLVKDGCCRPYDGDLADYRNLLLAKTEPEKKVKPKPEVPKVNVREERKSVSARLRRVEREMEKLNADRAAIEAAFQTPLTSEEIIRSQKELAWISAVLGEYEEEWLELSERLEQLGQ